MSDKKISKEYEIIGLDYSKASLGLGKLYSEDKSFRSRTQKIFFPLEEKDARAIFLNKDSPNPRLEIDGKDSEITQIVNEIKKKGIKLKEI